MTLNESEALLWMASHKASSRQQPNLPLDYDLSRGVKLRCTYRPTILRHGKIHPALDDVNFIWQLWTKGRYEAQRADPILADWPDDACGWEALSTDDVRALLQGESTADMRLRHASEAERIFARLS